MVRQFHDGMQARVQNDGGFSGPFEVTNGVKQGCVMALTLFSMLFSAMLIDFFFNSFLRPFQDYSSSYETGQSVGGAKTGEPREKPPGTPASRTWLVSHVVRAGLEPTPDTAVR